MTGADLPSIYRSYIACLNARDWSRLDEFVDANVWSVIDKAAVEAQLTGDTGQGATLEITAVEGQAKQSP